MKLIASPARRSRHGVRDTLLSRLTLDHVWLFSVLALVWLFISVLPLPPNDLWWHMAAGRIMLDEGAWLTTNRWAYTVAFDAPYVYQSWLSEILLYGLWRVGDVPLLVLGRTVAIVLSYGLIAWHSWRRSGHARATALALIVAVLIGWNNWTLRPQTLALLPGAAFVVVLDSYLIGRRSARSLLLLPPILALWVNMHGSFVLGLGLLGLAALGMALPAVRGGAEARQVAWERVRLLGATLGACVLTTMLHPLGFGIFGYVRDMLTNTPLQRYFVEWQAPTPTLNVLDTGFWFYAMLLGLAALMALSPRRPRPVDVLWFCALGWLAAGGVRYAMWFALALMPLLAEQLGSLGRGRRSPAGSPTMNAALVGSLALLMLLVLPWFQPGRYLGPAAERLFANAGPYRMLLSNTTPIAASEWLAAHPIDGRLWVDQSYSSYTIWRLPETQVFTDLRVELFPESIWLDYFAIDAGTSRSLELIAQYEITHLMIDRELQTELLGLLQARPGWCERYADTRSVIMARCDAAVGGN